VTNVLLFSHPSAPSASFVGAAVAATPQLAAIRRKTPELLAILGLTVWQP
jgi:hypothetical protein